MYVSVLGKLKCKVLTLNACSNTSNGLAAMVDQDQLALNVPCNL